MKRRTPARVGPVSTALAADRLGVASVSFFVLASMGPLLVVAGVVPSAYARPPG